MKRLKPFLKSKVIRPCLQAVGCGYLSSVGLEHIDLQLVSILKSKRNGFFIEAGANDGITQSNTYYLEKILGWQGLLVEPLPHLAATCQRNRNGDVVNSALVRHDYPDPTTVIECANLMSIVNDGSLASESVIQHAERGRRIQGIKESQSIEVPTSPLSKLLKDRSISHVDFFSLDVEGYEPEVLKGIDFSAVTFDHIFIETRASNEAEIESVLNHVGLIETHSWLNPSCCNKLYVRKALADARS